MQKYINSTSQGGRRGFPSTKLPKYRMLSCRIFSNFRSPYQLGPVIIYLSVMHYVMHLISVHLSSTNARPSSVKSLLLTRFSVWIDQLNPNVPRTLRSENLFSVGTSVLYR